MSKLKRCARGGAGHLVELIRGCVHRFLAEFTFVGMDLLYCDPPVRGVRMATSTSPISKRCHSAGR